MKYWNKTINLLLKVNNFCKNLKKTELHSLAQATNQFGGWSSDEEESPESESPDSPISKIPESVGKPGEDLGTFANLKTLANTIENPNPDVANQIDIIAELLKIAIRNNKGYSYIMNAINNFVGQTLPDNYPEDDDDDEDDEEDDSKLSAVQKRVKAAKKERFAIEMAMNKTSSDIKKRALSANIDIRKQDPLDVLKVMRAAKLDYESILEQKDRNLNDRPDAGYLDPNQKQISEELKEIGISTEESSDLSDIENELGFGSNIDIADIAGKREREGSTPGMGVRHAYNYKDYIEFYNEEISNYKEDLNKSNDHALKANLNELINTLEKLKINHTNLEELSKDISWTIYPATEVSPRQKIIDQPELKNEYDSLKNEQKLLKKKRSELLQKVKKVNLNKEVNNLEQRYNSTRSEKEKFLIAQQILLNQVRLSTDLNKSKEIELRKKLINSLGGNIPLEQIQENPDLYLPTVDVNHIKSMLDKIKEASSLRKTQTKYYSEIGVKNKEKIEMGRKFGDISGLITELKQNIPNIKMGEKKAFFEKESKRIFAEATEAEQSIYKPYIDAISMAKRSGNKKEQANAIKQLASALNAVQEQFVELKKQLASFEAEHLDVTFWRKSLEISDKANLFKKENLSNEDLNQFNTLILTGKSLLNNNKLRPSSITIINNLIDSLTNRYNQITKLRIAPQNEEKKVRVEIISPETGEVTIEEMTEEEAANIEPSALKRIIRGNMSSKNRKNILAKIANKSIHDQMTNKIMNDSKLEKITDSDQYAHEVFQEMLNIIKNDNKLD